MEKKVVSAASFKTSEVTFDWSSSGEPARGDLRPRGCGPATEGVTPGEQRPGRALWPGSTGPLPWVMGSQSSC